MFWLIFFAKAWSSRPISVIILMILDWWWIWATLHETMGVWSNHPTHMVIRVITRQEPRNHYQWPLREVASICNHTRTGLLSNLAVKSPNTSVGRHAEHKSGMQEPNSSPPYFSSLLSSSVWNCESDWMQQGVGCGSFSTTQMLFFPPCLLPSGGKAEADLQNIPAYMSISGGSYLRV